MTAQHLHAAMLQTYGFGLFSLPAYREVAVGSWRIRRHLPSLADGYFSGVGIESNRCVLYKGRTAWMSTGRMEQESHAFHVHAARGTVVVAGLGIGMYAYASASKPEVERVVVIERSPEVVELVLAATDFAQCPWWRKLTIVHADALGADLPSYISDATEGRRPDYLFADIWPTCGSPQAPREAAALVASLDPKAAGWWGQELSFGYWCRGLDRQPDEAAVRDYFRKLGVPVPVTPGYVAFCAAVVAANVPGERQAVDSAALRWWRRYVAPLLRRAAR